MQCVIRGFLLAAFAAIGCTKPQPAPPTTAPLTLATTTSTRDSGLLDVLVPSFRERTGIDVKIVAVGSGQALELGRRGDADVLLVHSPAAEMAFMNDGMGLERIPVMANDFVLVGPADDPAQVRGRASITDVFREIARRQTPFVSRADDSGTHRKEQAIWQSCEITPSGDWYLKAGTGMGQALRLASEKGAYVLSDRATFLAIQDNLDSIVVSEGDSLLENPYHVIVVNPSFHPGVNHAGARRFVAFLTSPAAREAIAAFGLDRFGRSLFVPAGNGAIASVPEPSP